MAEMSRRFNFDDFDEQIREALEDNDVAMASLAINGVARIKRPGEIGGVLIIPSWDREPEPPEAA